MIQREKRKHVYKLRPLKKAHVQIQKVERERASEREAQLKGPKMNAKSESPLPNPGLYSLIFIWSFEFIRM